MQLSQTLIQKLNQSLGITGAPHQLIGSDGFIETGCYQWVGGSALQDYENAKKAVPPSVVEALQRMNDSWYRFETGNFEKNVDKFIANEPAQVQADYALYQASVQRAWERYNPTPPKIARSVELEQASKLIEEITSHENFEKRGNFDIKAFQSRVRELWRAEPAEIQAEVDAYGKQLLAYQEQAKQQAQREKLDLDQVRALLAGETAIAYRAGITWEEMPSVEHNTIVVAPTSDPWDALRIEGTQGNNFSISTEELIAILKELDAVYGVDVTGAAMDGVEFSFKRVPKGKEAREVGKRLYEICPDLGEPPVKFPKGRVSLWWD
jgi:hypothetical protein